MEKSTAFMLVTALLTIVLIVVLTGAVVTTEKTTPLTADEEAMLGDGNAAANDNGLTLPQPGENSIVAIATSSFIRRFDDSGSCADWDVTIFKPKVDSIDASNWYWVGDVPDNYHVSTPNMGQVSILIKASDPTALAKPVDWKLVWNNHGAHRGVLGKPGDPFALWVPVAPDGYVALGCVMTNSFDKPSGYVIDSFRCVKKEYCAEGVLDPNPLWWDKGSHAEWDGSIWRIHPKDGTGVDAWTYWATSGYWCPTWETVYCLKSQYVVDL